jgi:hypothetical protein
VGRSRGGVDSEARGWAVVEEGGIIERDWMMLLMIEGRVRGAVLTPALGQW